MPERHETLLENTDFVPANARDQHGEKSAANEHDDCESEIIVTGTQPSAVMTGRVFEQSSIKRKETPTGSITQRMKLTLKSRFSSRLAR